MLLNLEQIKKITRGVDRVEEQDGIFHFYRFTNRQMEAYHALEDLDFYNKTHATAGVRMAFRTDASCFSFDYQTTYGSSRRYAWFDVYVDGSLVSHFGSDGEAVKSAHAQIKLPKGEKDVEIYFPWSRTVTISNVEIDDGATVCPLFRKHTMISFGDSITHGYDAIYPSLAYASHLARLMDADQLNKGIGGERFFPALLEEPDAISPDYVTVAYGTNDWNCCTPEVFAENCKAFYTRLSALYPNARIFAITPIWRADHAQKKPYGADCVVIDGVIREICRDLPNVTVIRGWNFVPHKSEFFSDLSLHPNDFGFGSYAANLYAEIVKAL